MNSKSSVKVEAGKLVKTEIQYGETFEDVKIRGDFFLEPPEALNEIQSKVKGLPVETSKEEIAEQIEQVDADFIGFKPSDVAEAVKQAVEGEEQ